MLNNQDEKRQLDAVREDAVRELAGRLPAEAIQARFEAIVADFAQAPVRTYVPVLVRRRLRDELAKA